MFHGSDDGAPNLRSWDVVVPSRDLIVCEANQHDPEISTVARLQLRFHADTSKLDPRLVAYLDRCTSRPAFKRALDAQLADFRSAAA